jgi:hypothetical protein
VQLASQPDRLGGLIGQDTPELVAPFDAELDEEFVQRHRRSKTSGECAVNAVAGE